MNELINFIYIVLSGKSGVVTFPAENTDEGDFFEQQQRQL